MTFSIIKLEKVKPGHYRAFWENGHDLGDILMNVDGYYSWWPKQDAQGYLDELFLLTIYKTLHNLNE
jgi:hypothetical protein